MRKLFWAVLRSHSQGAQGGILDQLFGKVSYLIGLVALFAVVGYVIYDQLSASLEAELQSVVAASVLRYQTTGKFPADMEGIIARGLADSQVDDGEISVGDYDISMGYSGEAFTGNGAGLDATKSADLGTVLGSTSNRSGILIVEGVDNEGDCETLMGANLSLGKLKGIATVLTSTGVGTPVLLDNREAKIITDCPNVGGTAINIAFGYSFR